jgi:5-hydroxyisourate hydrolase
VSAITTHVLDTSIGRPAAGVRVRLYRCAGATWVDVAVGETDADGRCRTLLQEALATGSWRLTFDTGSYFARRGVQAFYPEVAITFVVEDATQHFHVPLLVSPFSFSTYRGS